MYVNCLRFPQKLIQTDSCVGRSVTGKYYDRRSSIRQVAHL